MFYKQDQPTAKYVGLTSPISLAEPTVDEQKATTKLLQILTECSETNQELLCRTNIMEKLSTIYNDWMHNILINQKRIPPHLAEKINGKLLAFGSYRLGVNDKGADIDVLCVAPIQIDRKDFFTSFFELLKKQPEICKLSAVESAYVPIITLNFNGIDVDILFARLLSHTVPDNLANDKILKNIDPKCVRSLNGSRVTEQILNSVPNENTFRQALRAIKLWAKKREIYSNCVGYFGGVAWAILVARTCQLYPNADAATLVQKFFKIFAQWKWPLPVFLQRPSDYQCGGLPVWDSRNNIADRYHLMPIITPAYPHQNTTFNVTGFNRSIIVKEIKRGAEIVQKIISGTSTWEHLLESPHFFNSYKHYITVIAKSDTTYEKHLEWNRLVASRLRHLLFTMQLDRHIHLAHVHPHSYEVSNQQIASNNKFSSMWFIGLEFDKSVKGDVELTTCIRKFNAIVYSHATASKSLRTDTVFDVQYLRRKQLAQYVPKNLLNSSIKKQPNKRKLEYEPDSNGIKRIKVDN